MNRIKKQCECCGIEFSIPKCRDWREHSCSSSCKRLVREQRSRESAAYRSRSCLECGTRFVPRMAQIRNGDGRYCSNRCGVAQVIKLNRSPEVRAKTGELTRKAHAEGRFRYLRGEDNPNWKGGRWMADGYVWIRVDGKPVAEHRHVVEMSIGRPLRSDEIVHHINHIRTDNRLENLQIMSRAEHIKEHHEEILSARWASYAR